MLREVDELTVITPSTAPAVPPAMNEWIGSIFCTYKRVRESFTEIGPKTYIPSSYLEFLHSSFRFQAVGFL